MRDIKFRAWDKEKNKMIFFHLLFKLVNTNQLGCQSIDQDINDWIDDWTQEPDEEVAILMQYTGLKDKNGVEIYDGDIVKHDDYGQISIVEWSDEDWGWIMKSIKNWNPKTCFIPIKDEVIGNIYQNPELLEETIGQPLK